MKLFAYSQGVIVLDHLTNVSLALAEGCVVLEVGAPSGASDDFGPSRIVLNAADSKRLLVRLSVEDPTDGEGWALLAKQLPKGYAKHP